MEEGKPAQRFVVLGGGISGLATTWFLKKRFPQANVTLVEKCARLGGWIHSQTDQDFFFEQGPRSCRTHGTGEETLKLIQDLRLEQEVVVGAKAAHRRYLYSQHKLRQLPSSILSLLSSPWTWGPLSSLLREYFQPVANEDDESVYAFISRRLSPSFANQFMDPLIKGIYAGDMHQLSMKSCFPKLYEWEKEKGSLFKGAMERKRKSSENFILQIQKSSLFTFKNGMETLIHALAKQMEAEVRLSSEVKKLRFTSEEVHLELAESNILKADHVISTIPSYALAPLVSSYDRMLGDDLKSISYASIAMVNIGFSHSVLKKKGFGYLIPSMEKEPILGMVWDSSAFPEQNRKREETRLTVMMGGAHGPQPSQYSSYPWKDVALECLSRHLGINTKPDLVTCQFTMDAIPQYHIGHAQKVYRIQSCIRQLSPHLSLLGNSFFGVSVNDCIAQAKAHVARI